MTIKFLKQLNDDIIESIIESSDEEILSQIGKENYPTWDDITFAEQTVSEIINKKRIERLEKNKQKFSEFKNKNEKTLNSLISIKSIEELLADIVKGMQNKDKVPNGLLVAFREQSHDGNDDAIREIWKSMVKLKLIDNNN